MRIATQMRILDDLLSTLDYGAAVKDIRLGPFWTAVHTHNCGLASTPHDADHRHGDTPVRDAGRILDKTPAELAQLAYSESTLEAAIGVAAVNSLLEIDERSCTELNAADFLLANAAERKLAVVGHFPFIRTLREAAGELWVVEKNPCPGDIPESEAPDYIPHADIVAISGSTFVNHTIQGLLDLCSPKACVVVLGPTTPLSPVLFDYGIDVISGTRVIEPDTVFAHVSQGASFRQMKGVRLLTMRRL